MYDYSKTMKTLDMYDYSKTIETYQNILYVWLLQSYFTAVKLQQDWYKLPEDGSYIETYRSKLMIKNIQYIE